MQLLNNRITPAFKRGRFYNFLGEKKSPVFLPSLAILLKSVFTRFVSDKLDLAAWREQNIILPRSKDLVITWIGHATFLIQVENINILTDPVFEDLSFIFSRILPAGVARLDLPPIDFVLLSHNHRDHMEVPTLEYLKKQKDITFLVPMGLKKWFSQRGFSLVREYTWWQQDTFEFVSTFTFLPARHWSQRGIFDYNKSLWGSWLIEIAGRRIYFAGDTAYGEHFKQIGNEFDNISIACMPIGPCEPRAMMADSHVNAEEAGQAFLDLRARHFIPMHWGTFYFGSDHFFAPLERLTDWWNAQKFTQSEKLHAVKVGQQLFI